MAKHKCSVIAGVNKGNEVIATKFIGNYLTILVKTGFFSTYAVDIKPASLDSYEIIYQDTIEEKSSEILVEKEELMDEIASNVESCVASNMYIVALKFKNGDISVIEVDEKKMLLMVESLKPHPLTQFIS